jgi:uncharacterized SAM-binding protein YcdF (DUF218 family)
VAEHAFLLAISPWVLPKFQLKMKILFALLGLVIILFLSREQWLLFVGDFLVVEDTLQPADVIHVIAGDDYRTDYAIQLYKEGYGKTLFFTGGWCTRHQYRHGEHAEQRSQAQWVTQDRIAFDETTVTSTYMEAERLKEWISHRSTPVHSVIVVSDPFHMRRVRWTYQKLFGEDIEVRMAPVPFSLTPYQRSWWRDSSSSNYVKEEYTKYFYYIVRYQLSWGKLQEWLASFDRE